jgi:hypothetical protein
MSEFDTAPAAPEFECERRPAPAPLSPRWQAIADAQPSRPLSEAVAREWRAKGQDR